MENGLGGRGNQEWGDQVHQIRKTVWIGVGSWKRKISTNCLNTGWIQTMLEDFRCAGRWHLRPFDWGISQVRPVTSAEGYFLYLMLILTLKVILSYLNSRGTLLMSYFNYEFLSKLNFFYHAEPSPPSGSLTSPSFPLPPSWTPPLHDMYCEISPSF